MAADHTPAEVRPGLRVRVHVNLHKGNLSVVDPRISRVIASVDDITLTDVSFRVQPGGLRRIREQRQRTVCAYAVGTVAAVNSEPDVTGHRRVTFNPFTGDTFMCGDQPIHAAPEVVFRARAGWMPPATARTCAEAACGRPGEPPTLW
jgi:hypothetical protein